ncbi:SGNH/GDSL hydrolase family protein [Synechococcus sp. UW179A]|uniref:SGNH/GDSL hydrolase family protein n=1 Tax=Synechococcus sp. UW179A TaxID=2575510 RepID=UPI000E0F8EBA|nr:SGNH/GDSL hydrolase family protein [Synechococcus sp. UW179A]
MYLNCPPPIPIERSNSLYYGHKNIKGITVFGDSMSDFGSRSAAMYKNVLYPKSYPAWSGLTFNHSNNNWQTFLRQSLGAFSQNSSCQEIANSLIGGVPSTIKANDLNPSYALGGALTDRNTYFDLLKSVGQFPQELLKPPYAVSKLGIRSQIEHYFQSESPDLSAELVVIWGGGNDILATVLHQQDLRTGFRNILINSKANLISLLRNSNAKIILVSSGAPIIGSVDGVSYALPYLRDLPPSWQEQIHSGAASTLYAKTHQMAEAVTKMFPYATIIPFNSEYEYNWERFGVKLGNFRKYGIINTTDPAQQEALLDQKDGILYNSLPHADLNHTIQKKQTEGGFLYFDSLHPTESGHRMLAKAIELTLEEFQAEIKSSVTHTVFSTKESFYIGTSGNDFITSSARSSTLQGVEGNDILQGSAFDDDLQGGIGNDKLDGNGGSNRLNGGPGADVFVIGLKGLIDGPQIIEDFNSEEGDRILLSPVLSELAGDPFWVSTTEEWGKALTVERTQEGNLKLVISLSPINKNPGVIILYNVKTLDLNSLS